MVFLRKNKRYRPSVEEVCSEYWRRRSLEKKKKTKSSSSESSSSSSSSATDANAEDEPMELPDLDDDEDDLLEEELLNEEEVSELLLELGKASSHTDEEGADEFDEFMQSLSEFDLTGFLDDIGNDTS